jgi:hypothetical protein
MTVIEVKSTGIRGFKIRDKRTGKFQMDGSYLRWEWHGYIFSTIGALKCHLKQVIRYQPSYARLTIEEMSNWEILDGIWFADGTNCSEVDINWAEGLNGGKF